MNEVKKPFNLSSFSEMSQSTSLRDVMGRNSTESSSMIWFPEFRASSKKTTYKFVVRNSYLETQQKSQSNNTVVTNAQIEDDNFSVMTGTLLTEQTSIRDNTQALDEPSFNHDNESIITATNLSIISSANSFSSDDTVKGC